MNILRRTRWLQPFLVLVLMAAPTLADERKITIQGTIEDAEHPGTRLDDITVQVMVGAVEKGKSTSKTVQKQGKMEMGVYNFDVEIDSKNPVINVFFQDRDNRVYFDDKIRLLVGESPLSIPKALLKKSSRRASADHWRTHAESLGSQIFTARSRKMSQADVRKNFGPQLSETVLLSTQQFPYDEGLQAELGRLVQAWDARPSAALSSQGDHILTYRAGSVIVSYGPEMESKKYNPRDVFFPSGKWDMTHGGEVICSSLGGGVVLFNAGRELGDPFLVRPAEIIAGPQSVVAAASDGRLFASAGPGGTVTLYSREGPRKPLKRARSLYAGPGAVRALTFTPDSQKLAAATLPGTIVAWSTDNGNEILRLGLKEMDASLKDAILTTLTFAPDKRYLTVGTGLDRDGKVVVIDANRHTVHKIFAAEQGGVTNVTYAVKGEYLLVEYDHSRGAILDSSSGETLKHLLGTLVPSSDGDWLGILEEENLKDPRTKPVVKPIRDFLKP